MLETFGAVTKQFVLISRTQIPHTGAEILRCLTPAMVLCSVPHMMRFSSEFLKKISRQYRTFQCQVCSCWMKPSCSILCLTSGNFDDLFIGSWFYSTENVVTTNVSAQEYYGSGSSGGYVSANVSVLEGKHI